MKLFPVCCTTSSVDRAVDFQFALLFMSCLTLFFFQNAFKNLIRKLNKPDLNVQHISSATIEIVGAKYSRSEQLFQIQTNAKYNVY